MKIISIIVPFLFLLSCKSHIRQSEVIELLPENSRTLVVKLLDSLGTVTINVPNRYDSFFQWTNTSDCGKPCDHEQYRFQPKYLPVFQESGFYYHIPQNVEDSTEQFTIVHSGYFPFRETSDSNLIYKISKNHKEGLLNNATTYKILFDTVQKLNNRYFSITIIDLFDSTKKIYSKKVLGITTIKGNAIEFNYSLLTKKKDSITTNFIKNSIDLLKTVGLSKGM